MGRKANGPLDVWKHVDTQTGNREVCWPWTGRVAGRDQRPLWSLANKSIAPTRVIYELFYHPIPEGYVVRHKCDNALCCNPHHLEIGTRSDNENDKYIRDRSGLPVVIVREIRRLLVATDLSASEIAQAVSKKFSYSVSREAVRNINIGARRTQGEEQTQEELTKGLENAIIVGSDNSSDEQENDNEPDHSRTVDEGQETL